MREVFPRGKGGHFDRRRERLADTTYCLHSPLVSAIITLNILPIVGSSAPSFFANGLSSALLVAEDRNRYLRSRNE
jgi:hypothetical protein